MSSNNNFSNSEKGEEAMGESSPFIPYHDPEELPTHNSSIIPSHKQYWGFLWHMVSFLFGSLFALSLLRFWDSSTLAASESNTYETGFLTEQLCIETLHSFVRHIF